MWHCIWERLPSVTALSGSIRLSAIQILGTIKDFKFFGADKGRSTRGIPGTHGSRKTLISAPVVATWCRGLVLLYYQVDPSTFLNCLPSSLQKTS